MTAGGQDSALGSVPVRIDTSIAHPARVYDYWLGGKDNYPADREAAEAVIRANPGIVPGVRANRAFLVRAVRHLVGEAGISQILDLGTGLPAVDNVHEVAQAINPDTRVVYVDNDPIVLVHAHALLVGSPGTIAYLDADLHQPAEVLRRAGQTLDLDRPVGLLLLMTLQFLVEDAYDVLGELIGALAPGSYLAVSHPLRDDAVGIANAATSKYNEKVGTQMVRRTREEITRFFDGLELIEPGVVSLDQWRPAPDAGPSTDYSPALCGVARKP
ncbi:MAG: SAM-dependent methyltransferase [Kineosporiaceae bacterium]|nr:SAM-dependent methyltransferase [Kineosporiaceae bacterium]